MKTLNAVLISTMLSLSFSIGASSQGHSMVDGHDRPMNSVTDDYHARSMMMDQIVEDPEMRQEMMHKMMQSMDVHQMMNDQEMKTRMQNHLDMVQAMLDSGAMDSIQMKELMGNTKTMSMMKMHMMCVQTSQGGLNEHQSMSNGNEHSH